MWNPGEPQAEVIGAALEEFTEATGIEVEVEWAGRQVLTTVATRLASGDVPDLTDQEGGRLEGILNAVDGLQGLADVYEMQVDNEDVTVGDIIDERYIDEWRTGPGEPFVVPYEIIGSSIWFNGADHPDLADNSPATWDEFIAVMEDLKADGREPIALDGNILLYVRWWYAWSVVRHGGPGLLPEAAVDETGEMLNDPAFEAAARSLYQLIHEDFIVNEFNATQWPAQQTAWAQGESPTDFLLMGVWAPSETAEFARDGFEYRSFRFPTVEGGAGNDAAEMGAIGFAVPEGAANPDAAKQFMTFFLNRDRLEPISSHTLNLTPRDDIEVPPQLVDTREMIISATEFFPPFDRVDGVAPDWTTNVLDQVLSEYFNGAYTPDEFVQELQSRTVSFYQSQ
jgi:raffinose/stachyose/melibiose transport system substrate-binding protein